MPTFEIQVEIMLKYLNLKSLRNEFDVKTSPVNALHGASTEEQAKKELDNFFGMEQTVAVIKPGLTQEKRGISFCLIKLIRS